MTRKMISFLGTTEYQICEYHLDGVFARPTRYIQEAIIDIYRKNGNKIDEIHMLLTPEAIKDNWLGEEKLYEQLQKYTHEDHLLIKEQNVSSKQEIDSIWNLFETISNIIEKGDRIVFDITHSFRFQPMLALLSIHFARITKDVQVDGIYYGVYDPAEPVKKFPIIDLTAFVELQDWITNVYAFTKTGRVEGLSSWLKEKEKSIRKVEKSQAVDLNYVKKLADSWSKLAGALQTNRSQDVPIAAIEAINSIETIKNEMLRPVFSPLNELLSEVEKDIKPLADEDPVLSGIAAIEWCFKHGLYQQTYTLADELAITAICKVHQRDLKDYSVRERVNAILNTSINIIQKSKNDLNNLNEEEREMVHELLQHRELLKVIQKIKYNRNDINHAGWRKNPLSNNTLENHFIDLFKTYKVQLLSYYQSRVLNNG